MPDTFWVLRHFLKLTGKKSLYPPLGLLTVAAMLPKEWEKRLVDTNLRPLTDEDLTWPDYVFLSAMNVQEPSARQIIAHCREAGVKVVAGGPLFTHEYLQFNDIAHFVLNEAELTLPQFLKDLEQGEPEPVYQSDEYANVHETPIPLWELVDMDQYQYAILQYSRGCPYHCDFCDVTALFGYRPRTKTADQIIAELEVFASSNKFFSVLFADDNLIGNKKELKSELLPALIQWRKEKQPALSFSTQLTINLVDDPELMEMLLEAGFRHIFIGVETPEEAGLVASRKQQNTKRDLLQNISRLHQAGFAVVGGFIIGFDTDTPSIFQRQIDFIQASGIVLATVNMLKAPPGTELHERMKREGRLTERFSFQEISTNFMPKMDRDVLYRGFRRVLHSVYSPEYAYMRSIKFLQEYNKSPAVENDIPMQSSAKYIGPLLRAIYYLGIVGKERRYFWKLIGWALVNRPTMIDWAVLNAVAIYQLRHLYLSYYDQAGEALPELTSGDDREQLEIFKAI
jgi:radical SAM superfamily enzyme YgiQ (UPF0313 family)